MRTVASIFSVLILGGPVVLFPQVTVSGEPARLSIDLDQQRPLSQDLYGANNECIFRPVWFDHGAYAEKYISSDRPFFRFPGGTGSNFYNPFTGFFDDDSPSTRDYSGHNERIRKFTDGAGRVPDEYLKWVKKHNVSYSLVLNVCTQTFEQNKTWIEKLGREGHKVARIEIGNEVFYGGYKWAFASGADYVERAKKITAVIRKELPKTKVGVVIPNQLYQDERMLTDQRPPSLNHPYGWIKELKGQTIGAIDVASSRKKSAPTLLEAVQLTHRSDLILSDAMQDTERCDRVELDINQQSLTLPPYSITRLKLTSGIGFQPVKD